MPVPVKLTLQLGGTEQPPIHDQRAAPSHTVIPRMQNLAQLHFLE
jgi:hypothetical protein